MKHVRIIMALTLMLCLVGAAGMVFAEEVIKVGACQPITGRFAFAGKHINQGLMDSLNYANEQGGVGGVVTVVGEAGQRRIERGRVLLVGCGGLGTVVATSSICAHSWRARLVSAMVSASTSIGAEASPSLPVCSSSKLSSRNWSWSLRSNWSSQSSGKNASPNYSHVSKCSKPLSRN